MPPARARRGAPRPRRGHEGLDGLSARLRVLEGAGQPRLPRGRPLGGLGRRPGAAAGPRGPRGRRSERRREANVVQFGGRLAGHRFLRGEATDGLQGQLQRRRLRRRGERLALEGDLRSLLPPRRDGDRRDLRGHPGTEPEEGPEPRRCRGGEERQPRRGVPVEGFSVQEQRARHAAPTPVQLRPQRRQHADRRGALHRRRRAAPGHAPPARQPVRPGLAVFGPAAQDDAEVGGPTVAPLRCQSQAPGRRHPALRLAHPGEVPRDVRVRQMYLLHRGLPQWRALGLLPRRRRRQASGAPRAHPGHRRLSGLDQQAAEHPRRVERRAVLEQDRSQDRLPHTHPPLRSAGVLNWEGHRGASVHQQAALRVLRAGRREHAADGLCAFVRPHPEDGHGEWIRVLRPEERRHRHRREGHVCAVSPGRCTEEWGRGRHAPSHGRDRVSGGHC
mmetsp:Transcript_137375/g.356973  ORF Transcript_137375/g.356973 Transcript_137375/m.356973 type:complete len:446 (-) Transcript_137375:438-1775(-)